MVDEIQGAQHQKMLPLLTIFPLDLHFSNSQKKSVLNWRLILPWNHQVRYREVFPQM